MKKDEIEAIRAQIAFYKEHREVLQFGRFYRGAVVSDSASCGYSGEDSGVEMSVPSAGMSVLEPLPGNDITWTVVSSDKKTALAMTMQFLTHPNTKWRILKPAGLDEVIKYRLTGRKIKFDLHNFGGLVNVVAPFHVRPDGLMHALISKFVKMSAEEETHEMYGDAMMYAGVHLKHAFAGTGYNDNVSYWPDFGSRIYLLSAVGKPAGQ